jgi:hypothetical protein
MLSGGGNKKVVSGEKTNDEKQDPKMNLRERKVAGNRLSLPSLYSI